MSGSRSDLHKARLRRDRIRREKHEQSVRESARKPRDQAPPFSNPHPFAMERSMREMQGLMEGMPVRSVEEANETLAALTGGGGTTEAAKAWNARKRDDPKWRAQELAYDAMEAGDPGELSRLVDAALELDPDCVDAQRLRVSLTGAPLAARIVLMDDVVAQSEQNMGESFIEEHMGRFWQVISTRPYMRAKQSLGSLLAEAADLAGAIAVYERMMELNPSDNQGVRYALLGLYLATGQTEAAGRVLATYPDEEAVLGSMAWARVLHHWIAEDFRAAGAALARARKVNPFVEEYLRGGRRIPEFGPALFEPGQDSEARVCAMDQAVAWKSHPEFSVWVRQRK